MRAARGMLVVFFLGLAFGGVLANLEGRPGWVVVGAFLLAALLTAAPRGT